MPAALLFPGLFAHPWDKNQTTAWKKKLVEPYNYKLLQLAVSQMNPQLFILDIDRVWVRNSAAAKKNNFSSQKADYPSTLLPDL